MFLLYQIIAVKKRIKRRFLPQESELEILLAGRYTNPSLNCNQQLSEFPVSVRDSNTRQSLSEGQSEYVCGPFRG